MGLKWRDFADALWKRWLQRVTMGCAGGQRWGCRGRGGPAQAWGSAPHGSLQEKPLCPKIRAQEERVFMDLELGWGRCPIPNPNQGFVRTGLSLVFSEVNSAAEVRKCFPGCAQSEGFLQPGGREHFQTVPDIPGCLLTLPRTLWCKNLDPKAQTPARRAAGPFLRQDLG